MLQYQSTSGTLRRCLRWALVAVFLHTGAAPGLFAADKFTVPIVVGGITYQGEGVLAEDGSIVVTVRIVYRQAVPGPTPPPVPPPVPPTPQPAKIAAIYLIHESGDGTPAFTAIKNSDAWKKEAERLGIRWLIFDKDVGAKKLPEVTQRAIAIGLPALVLLDTQKLCVAEKCPKTHDAMLARVKATVKP